MYTCVCGLSISYQCLCTAFTFGLLSAWKGLSMAVASASAVYHPTGLASNMAAALELVLDPTGTHTLYDSVADRDAFGKSTKQRLSGLCASQTSTNCMWLSMQPVWPDKGSLTNMLCSVMTYIAWKSITFLCRAHRMAWLPILSIDIRQATMEIGRWVQESIWGDLLDKEFNQCRTMLAV